MLRELWRYAGKARWQVVLYAVMHASSHIATLLKPLVFAQILNSVQRHRSMVMDELTTWLLAWVGLTLWFNLFHRFAQRFVFSVAYRARQAFLNEHYQIVVGLPLKWHSDHHSGDTIHRIDSAANALHGFAVNQFRWVTYFMLFWGPIVSLYLLSWQVATLVFVVALLNIFVMREFDRRLVKLYRAAHQVKHKFSAVLFDYISNVKTIVTLRLGRRTATELDRKIEDGYAIEMKSETEVNQWKWLSVSLGVVVLEVAAIYAYVRSQLDAGVPLMAGSVAAVFQYVNQLGGTYTDVARDYQHVIGWSTAFDASAPIREARAQSRTVTNAPSRSWEHVQIDGLDFAHQNDAQALSGVDLTFSRGEKIALVGESGSGKSSLLCVLRGLYEPDRVQVRLDGKSVSTLMLLFDTTSLVPQEPEIFEHTIRYNVTVGLDYTEAEVLQAIALARFDRVLSQLPNGLDTDVRERGVTLSGGERQRLALARGILAAHQSSIVLLDESTSSVDPQNEVAIYDNLLSHFAQQTVIAATHRLHMLARFDRVVVMDAGRVVQTGTFEELRGTPGKFAHLWRGYSDAVA